MKYFLTLILMALCPPALCTTVTCVPPTKNTDGTPFAQGTTIAFNVYSGPSASSLTLLTPTPLPTCSDVLKTAATPGTCFAVTAVETGNGVSAESVQTPAACIPPSPSSPTVSLSTTSTIAYMLVPGKDTYGVLIIGSVPLGTACDALKPMLTYFVVPNSSVTFTGSIKSPVVVATCS